MRLAALFLVAAPAAGADLLRDRWGTPHVFAPTEPDGFHALGWATAEDRLLQMDLFRRRARGTLAEVYGARQLESDRKFRVAGVARHCSEALETMPPSMRANLEAYARGVNGWVAANREAAGRRMAPLGVLFADWTAADCVCAWMGVSEVFDRWIDEGAGRMYEDFRRLAAEVGEAEALARPGMIVDDDAAVVPESEMARDAEVYPRLKNRPPQPGFWIRPAGDGMLRFSHAWTVDGSRSVTGKPLLESDPQTSVNNPPLWYEFHLAAGRFDVRGIGFAGAPAMLIGFNTSVAWGASALGTGSTVTFVEQLAAGGEAYLFQGVPRAFERRVETIRVKDGPPVEQPVLRSRHGFVINPLVRGVPEEQAWVAHVKPIEDKVTSLVGLLNMMAADNWAQFRDAMRWYYSPGLHLNYADREGNIAYQTLVHMPLTRRSPRIALEGWTGNDEVTARIELADMPHMLNPRSGIVSHANNLPVGSWYPFDLGIVTGGIGHTARSLRLTQLLEGTRLFSVSTFESAVHRDDVQAAVAGMFPAARRLTEPSADPAVRALLAPLSDWDLRFRAADASYPAAVALSNAALLTFRRSGIGMRVGGGEGGIAHLARRLGQQFPGGAGEVTDTDVRNYLTAWIAAAAADYPRTRAALAPEAGVSRVVHSMQYQANGPLGLGTLDTALDLVSPPLACGEVGTIWSQLGNSYTQIVDLADPDNSRTVLPPGISEDPRSAHHTDQMDLWVKGETHPAPLSREKVEALAVSRVTISMP